MDPSRISALLEPFLANDQRLTTNDLNQVSTYLDLLLRWNARINLTAIHDPEQIITRHFGESFFLARHLFPPPSDLSHPCHPERSRTPRSGVRRSRRTPLPPESQTPPQGVRPADSPHPRVLDLGSGAGFPALPLKIWSPVIHLALVESNHKKAAFLREVVRALALTDVYVFAERAESLAARLVSSATPASASSSASLALTSAHVSAARASGPSRLITPVSHPASSSLAVATAAAPPSADITSFLPADVVTFRAVENFDRTLPLAARFLGPNSRLAVLIGSAQLPKLNALPNMKWQTIPVPHSRQRVLSIGHLA